MIDKLLNGDIIIPTMPLLAAFLGKAKALLVGGEKHPDGPQLPTELIDECTMMHLHIMLRDSPAEYRAEVMRMSQVSGSKLQQVCQTVIDHEHFVHTMLGFAHDHHELHSDFCRMWAASFGEGRHLCESDHFTDCDEAQVGIHLWETRAQAISDVKAALQRATAPMVNGPGTGTCNVQ